VSAVDGFELRKWHSARPWQTNAALVLIAAGLLLLSRQLVSEYDHFTMGFSGVSGWSTLLYLASVLLILTQPVNRFTFPIVLIAAIAFRLTPLFSDPFLSSDIYRYVWDGIVQNAHISPYRYVPGNPALTFLRAPNQEIFDNINRRDYAHTIYPPVAQAIFYCITWISPTILAMKTAMVLFEGLTLYAMVKILTLLGLRREQSLLYAWCPLLVWEIAGSGHLDSVAMAFISLALLFRLRRQPIFTGLLLGLAVMTKLYPVVLLPALMMPRSSTGGESVWRLSAWDWRLPAMTAAVVAVGYAAYSSVGLLVFGFLGGYVEEEGMATGTRYFFLDLAQHLPGLHELPATAFLALCGVTFALLSWWGLKVAAASSTGRSLLGGRGEASFLAPALALAFALMLLFSPHYPWYILWLLPFLALTPNLPTLTYLMTFFYLFTTPLADGSFATMYLLNKILYGSLLVATLLYLGVRRRSIRGLDFHQTPSATGVLS
jgi:alpha-1,6-mannosyltransferase